MGPFSGMEDGKAEFWVSRDITVTCPGDRYANNKIGFGVRVKVDASNLREELEETIKYMDKIADEQRETYSLPADTSQNTSSKKPAASYANQGSSQRRSPKATLSPGDL